MGIFFGIIAVSTGSALAVIFVINARAFGSWIASWEKLCPHIVFRACARVGPIVAGDRRANPCGDELILLPRGARTGLFVCCGIFGIVTPIESLLISGPISLAAGYLQWFVVISTLFGRSGTTGPRRETSSGEGPEGKTDVPRGPGHFRF